MKKLALFAMLLGSSFLFGCETKEKPKTETKPAATADDKKVEDKTTTPEEKKPDATTPAPTDEKK